MPSVLQPWVERLTLMQQSVLLTAIRGPDGIDKNHIAKVLCRWLRRSFLLSAFERKVFLDPYESGGGSFTGPISQIRYHRQPGSNDDMNDGVGLAVTEYLSCVDAIPHHFQLHFMHAAEILGYKHPVPPIRQWWHWCYLRLVNDMHLQPESEAAMDKRLGDREQDWRAAEEVIAR